MYHVLSPIDANFIRHNQYRVVSVHRLESRATDAASRERNRLARGYGSMVPGVRVEVLDVHAKRGDVVQLGD